MPEDTTNVPVTEGTTPTIPVEETMAPVMAAEVPIMAETAPESTTVAAEEMPVAPAMDAPVADVTPEAPSIETVA